jgi:1-acyl-sn-glycerol-3-phosphate acyltransferase
MVFGEPLYFTGDARDLQVLRDATDQIMKAIQMLSGQEYVEMYASEAKAEMMKNRNYLQDNE